MTAINVILSNIHKLIYDLLMYNCNWKQDQFAIEILFIILSNCLIWQISWSKNNSYSNLI